MIIDRLLDSGGAMGGAGHAATVVAVVLALAVVLLVGKLAGEVAVRVGQPAVLGELVGGVLLGNLGLLGLDWFEGFKTNETLEMLAQLGVLILLFEIGLESTVRDMLKVGWSSLLVAVLGVVTPFALGWAVGAAMLPDAGPYVHAFLGATLTATSVGITARVLKDLDRGQTPEARIILGAAVIDDVLGLIILAVVTGVIQAADLGARVSIGSLVWVVAKAALFLVAGLAAGPAISARWFGLGARLRVPGGQLALALTFCFALAYIASLLGLAPLVGAYVAGLVLEYSHIHEFHRRGEPTVEELIRPIGTFLVPVFFMLMGMRVELAAFARPEVLGLAAVLTLAAIAGKQVCGFGAMGRGLDRLSIGIGMVPRGEVGLIFASIGMGLSIAGRPVIDDQLFSTVVIMVIVTTVIAPPALKWSLARGQRARPEPA